MPYNLQNNSRLPLPDMNQLANLLYFSFHFLFVLPILFVTFLPFPMLSLHSLLPLFRHHSETGGPADCPAGDARFPPKKDSEESKRQVPQSAQHRTSSWSTLRCQGCGLVELPCESCAHFGSTLELLLREGRVRGASCCLPALSGSYTCTGALSDTRTRTQTHTRARAHAHSHARTQPHPFMRACVRASMANADLSLVLQ